MLPTPYYSDPHVSLYHGDCLELLPHVADKSVACVLTDPPYEVEAHTKAKRAAPGTNAQREWAAYKAGSARPSISVDYEIDFVAIDEATRAACSEHFVRVASGWVLAFCQAEAVERWRAALVAGGAKWRRTQIWNKPDSAPCFMGNGPAQACECIATAWAGKGQSRWNGGGRRGFYEHCVNDFGRRTSGREHPTMKPLALMRELVQLFTDPGDLILDCFAGSGTTGLAARLEGRRAVLIEREERYCEVAARRLERMPRDAANGQLALLGGER